MLVCLSQLYNFQSWQACPNFNLSKQLWEHNYIQLTANFNAFYDEHAIITIAAYMQGLACKVEVCVYIKYLKDIASVCEISKCMSLLFFLLFCVRLKSSSQIKRVLFNRSTLFHLAYLFAYIWHSGGHEYLILSILRTQTSSDNRYFHKVHFWLSCIIYSTTTIIL